MLEDVRAEAGAGAEDFDSDEDRCADRGRRARRRRAGLRCHPGGGPAGQGKAGAAPGLAPGRHRCHHHPAQKGRHPDGSPPTQPGGSCASARRLRLLSVTGSRRPPSSAGRVHGFRDHVDGQGPAGPAMLEPVGGRCWRPRGDASRDSGTRPTETLTAATRPRDGRRQPDCPIGG